MERVADEFFSKQSTNEAWGGVNPGVLPSPRTSKLRIRMYLTRGKERAGRSATVSFVCDGQPL